MKIFLALLILSGTLSLSSCEKEEVKNSDIVKSAIIKAEGPTSGTVGQEIALQITLQGNNGCAVSGELQESADGNTRTIKGTVTYKGEICHQALVSVTKIYTFKANTAGTYNLKFVKADDTFISHTIIVN
jgi:hypothetical protein